MRKQAGLIDARLLGRIDAGAKVLGETRQVLIERVLEAYLANPKSVITRETLPRYAPKPFVAPRPKQGKR